jgi:hypothetical protein
MTVVYEGTAFSRHRMVDLVGGHLVSVFELFVFTLP